MNPSRGIIRADEIGELIMEKDKINPDDIAIECPVISKRTQR